jgi:hypothetical protein
MIGCECGCKYKREIGKREDFDAESQAGNGSSESLVFKKKIDENQKESYDVYEIFSGPLFAKEIKDFIENVAQNFMDSD